MKMNFCELIDKYIVTIPMIQRDYAQGRKSTEEEKVRDKLLSDINENLTTGLHLDFIYGSIDKSLFIFTPLDGQQRLTTLFLLHWYVAARDNYLNKKDKDRLKKFRYETRISSTDFIAALVDNLESIAVETKSKKKLSEKIKDCTWFFSSWEYDPTVSAILVMLDAIHEKFDGKTNSLVNLEKITFDFINLDDFKLTDDLYMKMNARGVPLTQFENFKAKFEKILESESLENKSNEILKNYFSRKIETDWVESFWDYKTEKSICGMSYKTIDEPFMRFFWYITEMIYFKNGAYPKDKNEKAIIVKFSFDNNNPVINYGLIESVYFNNQKNLDYLFSILNEIKKLKKLVNAVFCFEHQKGKVSLFNKNKEEIDLLKEVMEKGNIGFQDKLILFAIINYAHDGYNEKNLGDEHLHDLVRVTRNLLIRVRKQSSISFSSDLNDQKMHACINVIRILTCDENVYKTLQDKPHGNFLINEEQLHSVQSEIKKAKLITQYPELRNVIFKLEDHPEVKGAIHNFMPETEESFNSDFVANFQQRAKSFYEIWNKNCSHIVRGFLAVSDYSIWVGGSSNLGGLWFFGIDGNWNVILAKDTNNENKDFLVTYLNAYRKNKYILDDVIKNYINSCDHKERFSWRYYFVKYDQMTCAGDGYKNIFSWKNEHGFRVQDFSGIRSSKKHVNPYARTVRSIVNKHVNEERTFSSGNEENPLWLDDDIKLFCEENGWRVEIADISTHNNTCFIDCWLITHLPNIQIEAEKAWIKPTETMDMIEVAVAFICELYQLENPLDKNKVVDSYAEVIA